MKTQNRTTIFSSCRKYRYTLWREWDPTYSDWLLAKNDNATKYLMVIGLNPSTADETKDDPTIRRCIGFAEHWGFGALCMTNLFAWRDTKPENMKKAVDPIGPECGQWLCKIADGAGMILAAWGKDGKFTGRDRNVLSSIRAIGKPVHCLGTNGDGTPKHPLYIAAATQPIILP